MLPQKIGRRELLGVNEVEEEEVNQLERNVPPTLLRLFLKGQSHPCCASLSPSTTPSLPCVLTRCPPSSLARLCVHTHHSEIEAAIRELVTDSGTKLVKRAERSQHDSALLTVLTHEDETLVVQVCLSASSYYTLCLYIETSTTEPPFILTPKENLFPTTKPQTLPSPQTLNLLHSHRERNLNPESQILNLSHSFKDRQGQTLQPCA